MTPDERWMVSPAELLEMSLHRKRGPMVVDDLRALPRAPLVVAEGSTLPAGGVQDRSRAAWLLPTPELQRERMARRKLSEAQRNLRLLLTQTIESEARAHDVPIVLVDVTHSIDATVAAVERLFADALAVGPRAATKTERRALLREANEAIVAQLRGYYGRPWADGEADDVTRTFLCECGEPSCDVSVDVPVGVAAAAPVLAAEHA